MIHGLHHVTAMAGDAQRNLDVYAGILGMRLVKRSVNQDDPGTYHLFYADATGAPGSDLTFFPFGAEAIRGSAGVGVAPEVSLAVPPGSLGYWEARLVQHGIGVGPQETRFGEPTLCFTDPDGLAVALVESAAGGMPWDRSPVPAAYQVRGLHAARLTERVLAPTERFLTEVLGFERAGAEGGWQRYRLGSGGSGRLIDLRIDEAAPRGQFGAGVIHHLAWRVPDGATQLAARAALDAAGRHPTDVIDRFWFRSVYFREPGGTLFELATDGPGFAVDEDAAQLGERLVLPPWLEVHRAAIERQLPRLKLPAQEGEAREVEAR